MDETADSVAVTVQNLLSQFNEDLPLVSYTRILAELDAIPITAYRAAVGTMLLPVIALRVMYRLLLSEIPGITYLSNLELRQIRDRRVVVYFELWGRVRRATLDDVARDRNLSCSNGDWSRVAKNFWFRWLAGRYLARLWFAGKRYQYRHVVVDIRSLVVDLNELLEAMRPDIA